MSRDATRPAGKWYRRKTRIYRKTISSDHSYCSSLYTDSKHMSQYSKQITQVQHISYTVGSWSGFNNSRISPPLHTNTLTHNKRLAKPLRPFTPRTDAAGPDWSDHKSSDPSGTPLPSSSPPYTRTPLPSCTVPPAGAAAPGTARSRGGHTCDP